MHICTKVLIYSVTSNIIHYAFNFDGSCFFFEKARSTCTTGRPQGVGCYFQNKFYFFSAPWILSLWNQDNFPLILPGCALLAVIFKMAAPWKHGALGLLTALIGNLPAFITQNCLPLDGSSSQPVIYVLWAGPIRPSQMNIESIKRLKWEKKIYDALNTQVCHPSQFPWDIIKCKTEAEPFLTLRKIVKKQFEINAHFWS